MTRWKAAGIHLAISLMLASLVGSLLYLLWFPPPYFVAAGASTLIVLLMGVDIGIGPLLTLLVFNPVKPKRLLRLDLSIIGAVQLLAFGYGINVICQARPVFIVGAVDRLILVAADQLSDADLAKARNPAFRHRSWHGPQLVGALPPGGSEAAGIAMQAMAGGKDIDRLPKFYVPYARVADVLLKHAKPLSQLKPADAEQREELTQLETRADGHSLKYLPLIRQGMSYTAVIAPDSKQPVAVLSVNPW